MELKLRAYHQEAIDQLMQQTGKGNIMFITNDDKVYYNAETVGKAKRRQELFEQPTVKNFTGFLLHVICNNLDGVGLCSVYKNSLKRNLDAYDPINELEYE